MLFLFLLLLRKQLKEINEEWGGEERTMSESSMCEGSLRL